jgi:hypothetical protein
MSICRNCAGDYVSFYTKTLLIDMIFLTKKEIEQHGISGNEMAEISFQNKTFLKGSTYSIRLKESIIARAQNHDQSKGECLVIDHGQYLTFWTEKQAIIESKPIPVVTAANPAVESTIPTPEPPAEQYVKKTYRGTTYWEKVEPKNQNPENVNKAQENVTNVRKYRGQSY